ncbi:MAG: 50S ribosomal protein L6 [Opitutales bacterium]|nr:50S ribosomal protein L6 [Opitutales bacterium]
MSRIGKLPVAIPEKVKVTIDNGNIRIEGPKGTLQRTFDNEVLHISDADGEIVVKPRNTSRHAKAMHGTARSIIAGMVEGVSKGFEKKIIINGVGFRANLNGKVLELALGFSHGIKQAVPDGLTLTLADPTKITVAGPDKQVVGQFAAQVKSYYPAEPYKGKGVAIEGEHVRRKEGKKAG